MAGTDLPYRIANACLSIAVTLIFGALIVYFVPLWIINSGFHLFDLKIGAFRWSGLVPVVLGGAAIAGFLWGWISSGTGTPVLLDTPEKLIVRGSYRFVRNPMYVAYFLIVLGESLLLQSSSLLLYLLALLLFFHGVVVLIEEPTLKLTYGDAYQA